MVDDVPFSTLTSCPYYLLCSVRQWMRVCREVASLKNAPCTSAFVYRAGFDVELPSVFPSTPICIGSVTPHVPETVLSSVMSSDLCIVLLQDLLSSVCPLREVVTDSELTSGGRKVLRTSTEKATLSLLEASMS